MEKPARVSDLKANGPEAGTSRPSKIDESFRFLTAAKVSNSQSGVKSERHFRRR
jgi:hypothetical protein